MQPLFSVVIPVHNRAHQIGECLASVLAQSERDFEVIVVDNNSTDDLAGALQVFGNERIRTFKCSKPGPGAARNLGVREARGRFISFLDSDDVWRSDVLKVARPFMEKGAAVVYLTMVRFLDGHSPEWTGRKEKQGVISELRDIGEAVAMEAFGTGTMCAVRRDILSGSHQIDEELQVGEDLDWALRHVDYGPAIILNDEPRIACRVHDAHMCRNQEAYQSGTIKLIERARSHFYEIDERRPVRRMLIRLLMGCLVNIARYWGGAEALKLFPSVARLAFTWREFRLVLFPDTLPVLVHAWFKKKINRFLKL